MHKDNPACYECPKGKNKLHAWFLMNDGLRAKCKHCKLILNEADTVDMRASHG